MVTPWLYMAGSRRNFNDKILEYCGAKVQSGTLFIVHSYNRSLVNEI